jgi:rubredoxin
MSRVIENNEKKIVLESVVHCPKCGFESPEIMPTDFCLLRYQCKNCNFVMTPTEGKCCIFCSYGSVPCPPIQGMPIPGLED